MDDELDYEDGYLDASMGGVPRSMSGDYYMGFMAYQDELEERKAELTEELDGLKNDVMDAMDSGDLDSARDALDEMGDLNDEMNDIDSEMYF
jgi:hypothetical protein